MTTRNQSRSDVVSTKWFQDLRDPKQREDFERVLRNDKVVLGKLKEIIDSFIIDVETNETSIEDFDSPSWALKQASRLGEKRGLKKIRDLLIFIDKE